MGTLKVGKLWYACELTRFFRYSSETVDDGVYKIGVFDPDVILVPTWTDINGDDWSYMRVAPLGYRLSQDTYYYRWVLLAAHSFDSVTVPHLTSELLSNWSVSDYAINEVISSTYECFDISSKSQDRICKKYYIKTSVNNTNSDISISCIRFEKTVYIADPTNIDPDGKMTATSKFVSGIYASYYLDAPVVIHPNEYKEIEIEISPDLLYVNDPNIKKQGAWYSREGCRMGISITTGGSYANDKYEYDEMGTSSDQMRKTSDAYAYDFPNGPYLTDTIQARYIPYCMSFLSHGIGVLVTDEPLSSYDASTHNSVWPMDFYNHSDIQYRVFPNYQAQYTNGQGNLFYLLSSKCKFTSSKGEVVFTITLRNVCQQYIGYDEQHNLIKDYVDFTVRCLRFFAVSYDAVWPNDNSLNPAAFGGGYGYPYITYYLPTPILVPKFETRKLEIHVSPLGISVS